MSTHPSNRWWILGVVMLGTFMAILDASIVNVALPHMMSSFGVNREQIEWVSTAFMLATAVAMPLVGWAVGKVGYRALYAGSLALFTIGSAACAFAWSFQSLVAARVLQAIGGGAIQPVGMAVIAEIFEPEERGRALGIWGTGIMAGPAIGPTLGGYLTDWFSWRSIFSVNLPFGVAGVIWAIVIMRHLDEERTERPLDTWGFVFLSLALIAGLLALAHGQDKGWTSDYIMTCLALTVIGLVMFLAVEAAVDHPLIDLHLFRIRNFSLAMILAIFRSVALFGGVFLLPLFLERLSGYSTISTGLWMVPGALSVGVTMPIAGRLADRHHPGILVTLGTAITGVSLMIYGGLDPASDATMIIGPQLMRGVGLALMMAPLITAAINSVPRPQVATATSFLNILQRVGGAFGIALLNTMVTNSAHHHAVNLGECLPAQSLRFTHAAAEAAGFVARSPHFAAAFPVDDARRMAVHTLLNRATVMGYQDGFVIAGVIALLGVPLSMFIQRRIAR